MQETQETLVLSLGWEDPLEKEMATDSTHEQRSLVGYSPWGRKESDTTERLHIHVPLSRVSKGERSWLWPAAVPLPPTA